jgi:hypothetical protein
LLRRSVFCSVEIMVCGRVSECRGHETIGISKRQQQYVLPSRIRCGDNTIVVAVG